MIKYVITASTLFICIYVHAHDNVVIQPSPTARAQFAISPVVAQAHIDIPELPTLITSVHELNNTIFTVSGDLNKNINNVSTIISGFDSQSALLCCCGCFMCGIGTYSLVKSDNNRQKIIGGTVSAVGLLLAIYARVITNYVNS